jgi:hypothetical protein
MKEGGLRARAFLGRWFEVVVVVSLVVAAVGGWLTFGAYAAPGTHEERRTVDEWTVEGSFTHEATVTDAANDTVFEPGTVVRNRSVYFQRVMPVLEGQFALAVRDAGAPVDVRIRRQLVVRSVETAASDEDPVVYWRENRTLGATETTVRSGGRTTVPFSVDVSRTVAEARNVSERLGSPGHIQTRVAVTVAATPQTTDAETRRLTFSLPIDASRSLYRVEAASTSETFSSTEVVTVANDPSPLKTVGGPAALGVGLLGAFALVAARLRDTIGVSEAERAWLAYRDDRADFDEWITTVRLPDDAASRPVARADTLADLVDVAIDTDNPVLQSPDGGVYYVLHDGYRYTFDAPPNPSTPADDVAGGPSDRLQGGDPTDVPEGDAPSANASATDGPLDETAPRTSENGAVEPETE